VVRTLQGCVDAIRMLVSPLVDQSKHAFAAGLMCMLYCSTRPAQHDHLICVEVLKKVSLRKLAMVICMP
jgi:hypothetical protein